MKLKKIKETIWIFSMGLKELEPKERTAFRLKRGYYAFCNDQRTFEEVGKMMGYKRQRIEQLDKKAERKLEQFFYKFKNNLEVDKVETKN